MPTYTVYWQPGCTSCLRAKEFLNRRGIDYESVNVRADPAAQERLLQLGARSIPVIARGADWVYGQDIDELAAFVGATDDRPRLPPAILVLRLANLLAAAERFTSQLPDSSLETLLPGRADRAAIDLAFHVPLIVRGFLDAAGGGSLRFEYFERRPAGDARTRDAVIDVQRQAAVDLAGWWENQALNAPAEVSTYYGNKPLAGVLERTAWHVAQHVRQLESLVSTSGLVPDGPLGEKELEGLPLPEGLWDREIGAQ